MFCLEGHQAGSFAPFFCEVGNNRCFRLYSLNDQNSFTMEQCFERKPNGETCKGFFLNGDFSQEPERKRRRLVKATEDDIGDSRSTDGDASGSGCNPVVAA